MAVKVLSSVQRALAVLEAIAAHQPVGVTNLGRLLGEDKSALQRVLVTLAAAGWIRPTGEHATRWELTERPLAVAGQAQRRSGLAARLRPTMESLRDATGESVILAVPDRDRIVAVDVVESPQLVRTAPYVGMVLPADRSAAAIALYAHLPPEAVAILLGRPIDTRLAAELERTRARGWSLNAGAVDPGSTAVGAAVLDASGRPVAALVVSAPTDRLPESGYDATGSRLARAAAAVSLAGNPSAPAVTTPA